MGLKPKPDGTEQLAFNKDPKFRVQGLGTVWQKLAPSRMQQVLGKRTSSFTGLVFRVWGLAFRAWDSKTQLNVNAVAVKV